MNKLLRAILVIHPFIQYALFRIEPVISKVLVLSGIVAVLIIYLGSLTQEKRKIAIPYFWAYVLVQSIFLGKPNFCIHISVFFLLYTTIAQMKIDWKYILKPLGYVCIAMSLLSILQGFGIRQFKYNFSDNPGLLGNATDSAMYIAAISPFLLLHKKGWLWFVFPITAILMLGSASAILGLFCVILTYFFIREYHARLISFLVLSLAGIFIWFDKVSEFFTPDKKLIVWSRAMTDWKDFAWFGRGLGNFEGMYVVNNVIRNMHNHYLYILYTLGMLGFFFFLWWLMPLLKNREAILPYMSVIAVLVMAACSVPMKTYPIVLLTAINLGILSKGENR